MKRLKLILMAVAALFFSIAEKTNAQTLSTNKIKYQVTYDGGTQTYTVWVVPQYATPNSFNASNNEYGGTARVTLKVPAAFTIQNITDVKGSWEHAPLKLGSQSYFNGYGLNPASEYYVIGKSASETNYGPFASGTAVPLFTFQGNGCFGDVSIVANTDPFVFAANDALSLNVMCSFYSRSGQDASGNVPAEQFDGVNGVSANPDPQAPTTPVVSPTSACLGSTFSASTTGTSGATYTWTVTPLATAGVTASTSNTLNFQPTASGSYSISVTQTVGTCTSSPSPSASVTVNPLAPAPIPTSGSATNTCPSTTANLVSLQPGAVSGQTYEWHTAASNPSAVTQVGTPTAVSAGTYYLYSKNTTTSCYSVASSPVMVTIAICCPTIALGPVTNPTSCASNTGSARIDGLANNTAYTISYVSGGSASSASYTSNGSGQILLATLPAGTYTSVGISSSCASNTLSFNLTDPATPSAPTNLTANPNPGCIGTPISLSVSSVSGVSYVWSATPAGHGLATSTTNTTTMNATAAGSYVVSVTQVASGCTSPAANLTVTVGAVPPTPNAGTVSPTNPSTCAGNNGSIRLSGYTPTTAFLVSYSKDGAPTSATITSDASGNIIIPNLTVGTYNNISVKHNATSCGSGVYATNVVLSVASAVLPPSTPTASPNPVCVGLPVSLATTGSAGATFTWTASPSGHGLRTSTSNSNSMTPTAPGSYTVSATQTVSGCTSTAAIVVVNVTALPPTPDSNNTTTKNPTSCLVADGTITFSGHTASVSHTVTYTKNGSSTSVNVTADGNGRIVVGSLSPGAYTNIVIRNNASGCSSTPSTTSFGLNNPSISVPTATPNPGCIGSPIALSTSSDAGSPNNFSWTGTPSGHGLVPSTTPTTTMTPTAVGTYSISVSQSIGGCNLGPATLQITINNPLPTPTANNVSSTNNTTCGGNSGTITLSGYTPNTFYVVNYTKGGVASTVSLSADAQGKIVITNLTAGSYSNFTVKDNSTNCTSGAYTNTVTLNDPTAPQAPTNLTVSQNPLCAGAMASLSVTNVSGATFAWSASPSGHGLGSSSTNTNTITPTTGDTYTLSVTQSVANCVSLPATLQLNVGSATPQPTSLTASQNPVCAGGTTNLSVSGANGAIFTWLASPAGHGLGTSTGSTNSMTPTAVGSYSVSVFQTIGGCPSPAVTLAVLASGGPQTPNDGTIISFNPSSCTASNGSIVLSGYSSNTAYAVTYSKAGVPTTATLTADATGRITIGSLPVGTYTGISVKDNASGCQSGVYTGNVSLTNPSAPAAPTLASVNAMCVGGMANLSATGASGAVYAWSASPVGHGLVSSNTNTTTMSPTTAGTYNVSVTQSVNGCISPAATTSVVVNAAPPVPTAGALSSINPTACNLSNGSISITGYSPNTTYLLAYEKDGVSATDATLTADASGKLTLSNLGTGAYSNFAVKNTTGNCQPGVYTGSITLFNPNVPPSPSSITLNPTGVCVGSPASLSASGVSGAVFNWSASPVGHGLASSSTNATTMNPSAAGTYTISVIQTASGCTSTPTTLQVTVSSVPPTPTLNSAVGNNPTTCLGNNGSIVLTGYMANKAYAVNYTRNGTPVSATATADPNGRVVIGILNAAIYSNFSVKDNASGCVSGILAENITLSDPTAPSPPNIPTANPTSACVGTPIALSTSGNAGATFTWVASPAGNGLLVSNTNTTTMNATAAGSYTVTVSQTVGGCTSPVSSLVVTVGALPPTPTQEGITTQGPTACGGSNGTISISGYSANTAYTLSYRKNGNNMTASVFSDASGKVMIDNLTAGTYSHFQVKDDNSSCQSGTYTNNVILSDPTAPLAPTAITATPNSICLGAPTALSATGLNGATFAWVASPSAGSGLVSSTSNTTTMTPTSAANYTVSVTQTLNGCVSPPASVIVNVNTPPAMLTADNLSSSNPASCSPANGIVYISEYTPNTSYTISYTKDGAAQSVVIISNISGRIIIPDLAGGVYSNFIIKDNGTSCVSDKYTGATTLTDPTAPPAPLNLVGIPNPSCLGTPLNLSVKGINEATFTWAATPAASAGLVSSATNATTMTPTSVGGYQVSVTQTVQGCTSLPATTTITVNALPPSVTVNNISKKNPTCGNNNGEIAISSLVANATYTLNYKQEGVSKSATLLADATGKVTLNALSAGVYSNFELIASGCKSSSIYTTALVLACNEPPIIIGDSIQTEAGKVDTQCMYIKDPQAADSHTVTLCSTPTSGTVTATVDNTTHQLCISFTPKAGFTGTDEVCVEVCDANGGCSKIKIPITVLPKPNPTETPVAPVVIPTPVNTLKDSPITTCLPIQDPNVNDTHTATICKQPTSGSVVAAVNNATHEICITYIPKSGFTGNDEICVSICDASGKCTPINIPVSVSNPESPDKPQKPIILLPPIIDTPGKTVTVCGSILDPNPNDTHTATLCEQPAGGTAVVSVNNLTDQICVTYTAKPGFTGQDDICINVCDQAGQCSQVHGVVMVSDDRVHLLPKAYLQGALFGVFDTDGLMRDDLRVGNYLPTNSPYPNLGLTALSNFNTVQNTVFTVTGQNAIVDWVFVELRSATDPNLVIDSRSALIQRDGDIVDTDGVSALAFEKATAGSFYVSIRHRNHLGVMSKSPISLNNIATIIDFRKTLTPTYLLDATSITNVAQVGVQQGVAMWAGNTLFDKNVIYQGSENDVNVIYQLVTTSPNNKLLQLNFKLKGYYSGDVNMDGTVQFQATGNDVEYIYQNVIQNHTGNAFKQNFFKIKQQLPQ